MKKCILCGFRAEQGVWRILDTQVQNGFASRHRGHGYLLYASQGQGHIWGFGPAESDLNLDFLQQSDFDEAEGLTLEKCLTF